jgi:D-tagatose-1,6-bisphosphate aldolase subunit GatZ/KbaZ
MTPRDYQIFVTEIAKQMDFTKEQLIFGGDHLGPGVWKNEPAAAAPEKSGKLIQDYVNAGFTKLHLDTSMKLGGDFEGALETELIARRVEMLAKYAEEAAEDSGRIRYVIGTEVPPPGGAQDNKQGAQITTIESAWPCWRK